MKQLLTWHTLDEKEPPEKHHLLVELDDYSMVSGNMTPIGHVLCTGVMKS